MTTNLTADRLLGRVLRREVDVSSLLAYCATLDPSPLQRLLQLLDPIADARVEVQHGQHSRLDVVLDRPDGTPQAVLELKVSATEHGDQLARYDEYADTHRARKFLVDLELPGTRCPDGWTRLNLADAFGCWEESNDARARGLAAPIADLFRSWARQAHGPFQDMDPAMVTVVTRSVSSRLTTGGLETSSTTTSAGQPSLVALEAHPSGIEGAFLCVAVRCQDKTESARPWLLRPGVHVSAGHDVAAARTTAHRLTSEIEPALDLGALRATLSTVRPELSAAISGDRPLKSRRGRDAAIEAWLAAASDPDTLTVPRHPVYHHDRGRRLAAQFTLDLPALTGADLADVIRITMDHLTEAARKASSTVQVID